MRLGFVLPQVGAMAGSTALVTVAQRAEAIGFDSLWVTDRLLFPLHPRASYPASADGVLPDPYKTVLDPLSALTYVAAYTSRVRLGTSILDIPFYNPVVLARQLTTLDVLSGGRLAVGLGLGWSPDEFEAAGADPRRRGRRADEFLQVLKAVWTTDPVEFAGEFFRVPKSVIGPKPVQVPHPPIYLAAYSPGAMARTARFANGWNPAGVPLQGMGEMMAGIRAMAEAAGRDPAELGLIVRANCHITEEPITGERFIYTGTPQQIAADVQATEQLGAEELFFEVQYSPGVATVADILDRMEALWLAVHMVAAPPTA